jgi:hypothetical protein
MRRIFKTKTFSRWMRKTLLSNGALCEAVNEMERGLVDAELGGNTAAHKVYKKRIPLPGKGKSSGVRTIVVSGMAERWFFLYGFEKNERDNITAGELSFLRNVADDWLSATDMFLDNAVAAKELEEICHE